MPQPPLPEHPAFIYGTAWKEDATERCVRDALAAGFRAIDTACQRKHYHEAGVGDALRAAFAGDGPARSELFLQTKFTYRQGQDHRLPYDPEAPLATQVAQSFERSLAHLGVESIDSYLLHGPAARGALVAADWEVWRAMEALHDDGRVGMLGISNVSAGQLDELVRGARVAPSMVQNRCFAAYGWDRAVREVCARYGIVYQGFSLLTANRDVWESATLAGLAERRGVLPAQLLFAFCRGLGILPITGTQDPAHMRADLAALDLALEPDERATIERLSHGGR